MWPLNPLSCGERVKAAPVNASLILFAKMGAFAAAISRGLAADVVILRFLGSSVA
jgi:hypothetical protein